MHLALTVVLALTGAAEAKKVKRDREKHAPGPEAAAAPVSAPSPSPSPSAPVSLAPVAGGALVRQPIGTCGCSVDAPTGLLVEAPTKTEDGSDIWTGMVSEGEWVFGVIAVRFSEDGFRDGEDVEALAEAYLDFLNDQFGIMSAAGYTRGARMAENPQAKGITDTWVDSEGDRWTLKCWVDSKKLAVLFVAGPGAYPMPEVQQAFLDGFHFE